MDISPLIAECLPRLDAFSYSGYPPAFSAFEQEAAPFFAALDGENAQAEAEALIAALEAGRQRLGRRGARARAEREKQVLALFLAPAAKRFGGPAELFAAQLSRLWNERYPRNRFFPGSFETILKGFDANLLGLPLRKK